MSSAGGPWASDQFPLFLSHTSAHRQTVGLLKFALARVGINAFVAHEDIEPSLQWQDVIETALSSCRALAAWITPDFQRSLWTDQEVGSALARGVPVIPVRVGANPHGFIAKYQGLPGYERSLDDVSREILEILAKNDSTSSHLMAPAAYALKSSSNYETSRTLFRAMNLLPTSPSIENAGCGVTAISGSQGS